MYKPIGHEDLRDNLKSNTGSSLFLVGPEGVGRTGIAYEWAGGKPFELVEIDQNNITKHLKPLEDNPDKSYVFLSTYVIPTISSRIGEYQVGFLPDTDIVKILERDFPSMYPRPLVAQFCLGTMQDVVLSAKCASYYSQFCHSVLERKVPDADPKVVFRCITSLACSTFMKHIDFPEDVKNKVTISLALKYVDPTPRSVSHTRLLVEEFYGELR